MSDRAGLGRRVGCRAPQRMPLPVPPWRPDSTKPGTGAVLLRTAVSRCPASAGTVQGSAGAPERLLHEVTRRPAPEGQGLFLRLLVSSRHPGKDPSFRITDFK